MTIPSVVNNTLNLSAMVIYILLIIATLLVGNFRQPVYRWFFMMVLCNFIGISCELAVELLGGTPGAMVRTVCMVLDYISYAIVGGSFFSFASFLYEYLNLKTSVPRWVLHLMRGGAILMIVLATIAQPTHLYSDFDAYNRYIQQPTFWVSLVIPLSLSIIGIAVGLRYARALQIRELIPLLMYPIAPIACYLLEAVYVELWVAQFGNALTLLLMYTTLHVELRDQLAQHEAKLADARISLMLSQIKPHFLYNSLTVISDLCTKDPEMAQETVKEFSEYLGTNLEALTSPRLVRFDEEMRHVETYLSLERKRFGTKLNIEYDIRTDGFLMPPLTLQPIVENAVLHGLTMQSTGGTLHIKVEKAEDNIVIIVADDGVGFDPAQQPDDEKAHLGLENVSQRLKLLCRGSLTVESQPGKGTTVTILIPREVF